MDKIDAVKLRIDFINGQFPLDKPTTDFMAFVRAEMAATARRIAERSPDSCDVGRFIAAMDHLQQAKNLLCDSAILGLEANARKKRKTDEK